jgi:hypothetical protein
MFDTVILLTMKAIILLAAYLVGSSYLGLYI